MDDRRRKGDLFNMVLRNAGSTVNGGDGRRLCLEALFWLDRVFLVVFCFLLIGKWRAQQHQLRGACCSLERDNVILAFC